MKALILIPSYKRAEVIDLTLKSLFAVHEPSWDITVCVGDNKASPETQEAITRYPVRSEPYPVNIGKAAALNDLLVKYDGDYDVICTMDNDMVILKPWYELLNAFVRSAYDYVGFGGPRWWWHIPLNREECPIVSRETMITVYSPSGIAGGLLAFKPEFLRAHPWTNFGGVYGVDDGIMCQQTLSRAVFYWSEDWIRHDPLSYTVDAPAYLRANQEKKQALNIAGKHIFPKNWDE